jgi:hypothetical protein
MPDRDAICVDHVAGATLPSAGGFLCGGVEHLVRNWRIILPAMLLPLLCMAQPAGALQPRPARRAAPVPAPTVQSFDGQAWRRVPVRPGGPALADATRPQVPRQGRRRCIAVDTIAAAQLFGDRAIELTLKGGQRWRLYLAQECPALSFYQGFYYQQSQAGRLCAGRDVIGARSGGECAIASIMPAGKARR